MPDADVILADVLRRLDALEAGSSPPAPDGTATFWALEELRRQVPEPGAVMLVGTVATPDGTHAEWQEGRTTTDLLNLNWADLAETFSALAHPVRLRLLRLVLDGTDTAKELTDMDEMGSTGQVYHHLRLLSAAGWLRSSQGHYRVPPDRLVPLLAMIAGALR